MRRWVLAGVVLLVAAAGAFAYVLARLDRYLTDQRVALQAEASALLGRPVTFDAIGVSWRGGAGASITNLAIGDAPRFGAAPFLTAARADVRLELLPALRGEYRIRRIVIDAPSVTLIRDAEGWNALSLARLDQAAAPGEAASPAAAPAPPTGLPPGAAALLIAAATIDHGTVRVVDRTRQPPLELRVDQLRVQARDLAVGRPLSFDLSAAVLGAPTSNFTARGRLEPGDPPHADIHAEWLPVPVAALAPWLSPLADADLAGDVGGSVDLSGALTPSAPPTINGSLSLQHLSIAVAGLPAHVEHLSGIARFNAAGGELETSSAVIGGAPVRLGCKAAPPAAPLVHCQLTADSVTAAQLGVDGLPGDALRGMSVDAEIRPRDAAPVLHATLRVADGQAHGAPFRALLADLAATRDQLTVTRLALTAFDGTLDGAGSCRGLQSGALDCTARGTIAGVQIAPLLASQRAKGAGKIDGRLTANGSLSANGRDSDALRAGLRGSGHIAVANGVLRHVNFAQQIAAALPGVGGLAKGPHAQGLLGSTETRFDSLSASVQLAAQRATTNDAQVRAADFSATLRGSATLAGRLDGHGTFTLSPALAREIVGDVPLLASLATDAGLTMPYTLSGSVDDPRVRPDVSALPAALARGLSGGVDTLLRSPAETERAGKRVLRDLDRLFNR